jgi:predicted ester cyclase
MSEENKVVARRVVEELFNHTGNLDAADELFAPTYVGHKPAFGDLHGVEAVRQFAATERQAIPDLKNAIEDMVAEGDKVVTRLRGRGTHTGETEVFGPPTGNRYEVTGSTIQRFDDDGKIVEDWTVFDALEMM